MFKVTKFPHGTLSWADCSSTDPDKTKKFYADVMGWGTEDIPIGEGAVYTMFKHDGETVAASSGMQEDMKKQGIPSHWNVYVTVDDVDSMTGKVTELGGTVIAEPFDVFDSGRMMVLQDPTGAMLSLWQAKNHIGAGLVNTPGAMTWNELATRDPEKAKAFYSKLLGWKFTDGPSDGYWMIENNGRTNGGMIKMDENWGEMPPTWSVYFSVADIKDTAEKVKASGGKMPMEITDAQGVGQFVLASDPTGAMCSFIQLNEPQPWTE